MKTDLSSKIKILMVLFWTLFNLTLTAWWMTFGLRLIKQVEKLSLNDLTRKQKMLLWEGGILFFMLITGGAALVYFVFREIQTNQKLRTFFATFSHDLKTSITSLRLQVESILDGPSPPSASPTSASPTSPTSASSASLLLLPPPPSFLPLLPILTPTFPGWFRIQSDCNFNWKMPSIWLKQTPPVFSNRKWSWQRF